MEDRKGQSSAFDVCTYTCHDISVIQYFWSDMQNESDILELDKAQNGRRSATMTRAFEESGNELYSDHASDRDTLIFTVHRPESRDIFKFIVG